MVLLGGFVEVGLADLNVVAKDLVVADLERGNASALALSGLQAGDVVLAAAGDLPQLIDVWVIAVAD